VGKKDWQANVTVLVHNQTHQTVGSATVSGEFSNAPGVIRTCKTGPAGTCTVTATKLPLSLTEVTFTVTKITHATLPYDASANHDPDGDSNGTSIIINQTTLAQPSWLARLEALFEGIVALLLRK